MLVGVITKPLNIIHENCVGCVWVNLLSRYENWEREEKRLQGILS